MQMMSAFSSYPPLHIVDSVYSHTNNTTTTTTISSPFSQDPNTATATHISTLCFPIFHHQRSTINNNNNNNSKQMKDSSSMVFNKLQSVDELVTNNLGVSMDNKRKFNHLNSAQSKDTVDNKSSSRSKNHKKSNNGNEGEEIGYVHVRARRGQATDSHSLAERVRREKISERMKTLQSLVPGCDKVAGKALMLDEIINYVQSMQYQVQFLSKKLGSFTPMFHDSGVILKPDQQCNPNEATGMLTNNFVAPDNYHPMLETSPVLPIIQHQMDGFQSNGELLWNVEQERQSYNNECGLLNNFLSPTFYSSN